MYLLNRLGFRADPAIFSVAVALTVLFVSASILFTDTMDALFGAVADWIIRSLGWFYILGVTTFLIFLVWIGVSRYGRVRLGGEDDRPEYNNLTWFAMLFAAGIGTILMFWGVAEPISHFAVPPQGNVEPQSVEAANQAMGYTFYHFGLHTWTIFCLPALCFGYFSYRRGLPLRVSSIFQPFLGERINGPIGRAIDTLAVIGTLFGVAVSLGLGTLQINSGLASLFGVDVSKPVQVLLITVITVIATISVALGLDKGIKWLSNINIAMAVGLLLFILVTGSTLYLVRGTIEMIGVYLNWLIPLSFWNDTFGDTGWQGSWTVFYWAWTITWSPFVGIFIARISKGRTIREFVLGVLGLPTAFTIVWFSVFGLSAINIEMDGAGGLVQEVAVEGDIPSALFAFLANFPFTTAVATLAVVIVAVFFITSSDSASFVVDMLASGRQGETPVRQRVFWAVTEGVVAATLIAATGQSGLAALQDVAIVIGLPFFVMGFLMMAALLRSLRSEAVPPAAPHQPIRLRLPHLQARRPDPPAGDS
ncbi:choline/carnitine/betaine transport [Spinactinospora alkalitolerans]|uniref:Choline/carnitine/betaine transport n=1 Tax=Spinactinospora alkalitolerans TaxID=687207 RepID=A0A852TP39_9ACTN|nr:BCCT family transporter [Spinactinospora alkalitolerans]NYE45375.1 choline/carnitine/betaine transport [Spinactinospora alkalitolerans]